MRSDARLNRQRILRAAYELFATEGLAVPVREIARRAGVGTGTFSRHFPTKDSLYEAIVIDRIERLVDQARHLGWETGPGEAFFSFVELLVTEGAADRGVAQALTGTGFDIDSVAARSGLDPMGELDVLLQRAQQAGAVRHGVTVADVKALVAGCLSRPGMGEDHRVRDLLLTIVADGLRPPAPPRPP